MVDACKPEKENAKTSTRKVSEKFGNIIMTSLPHEERLRDEPKESLRGRLYNDMISVTNNLRKLLIIILLFLTVDL